MDAGAWTWLEVAKLALGVMTPLALAGIGIYVHRVTKRFEHMQWRSQKLIEKRLAIYDSMAPLLNDVLCYYTYIGTWRTQNPPEVQALKRTVDKALHLAAPLFSPEFFSACMDFQNACYKTFSGWGEDARLRTSFERRKQCRPDDWKAEWEKCFADEIADPQHVRQAYRRVMRAFAEDIGVHAHFVVPPTGRPPGNIL
jgi:hypothetical protein